MDHNIPLNEKALIAYVSTLNIESYSSKFEAYKAIKSLLKFLQVYGYPHTQRDLEALSNHMPKRFIPPERGLANRDQYQRIITSIQKQYKSGSIAPVDFRYIRLEAIIKLIYFTGLRRAEVANLRLKDIDLINGEIFVFLGKGNKNRYVGINGELMDILNKYIAIRAKLKANSQDDKLFFHSNKKPISAEYITKAISKLAKNLGFKVSPHGLRRSFVTHRAQEGKPIIQLQYACGHSDIKTTMAYVQQDRYELVQAMKSWNVSY